MIYICSFFVYCKSLNYFFLWIGLKAKSVLTVEYMKVTTDHPLLSYMHPDTVAEAYLQGISISQNI